MWRNEFVNRDGRPHAILQHKLPLPYSLAGHKVIVGKGELVVTDGGGDHRDLPPVFDTGLV